MEKITYAETKITKWILVMSIIHFLVEFKFFTGKLFNTFISPWKYLKKLACIIDKNMIMLLILYMYIALLQNNIRKIIVEHNMKNQSGKPFIGNNKNIST